MRHPILGYCAFFDLQVTTIAGSGKLSYVDAAGTTAGFNLPIGLVFLESKLFVCDTGNHRIRVFSPDGDTLIKTWGSPGTAAGQFQQPRALAISGAHL